MKHHHSRRGALLGASSSTANPVLSFPPQALGSQACQVNLVSIGVEFCPSNITLTKSQEPSTGPLPTLLAV